VRDRLAYNRNNTADSGTLIEAAVHGGAKGGFCSPLRLLYVAV
jgi:hypothetical protein